MDDLVAVDLETTGFDPASDAILEIGAVRLTVGDDGMVTLGERFVTFVDPGIAIGGAVSRLTGIRDEDVVSAPGPREAVAAFAAFSRDASLVGHNVEFDLAFLEAAGLEPGRAVLDTIDLASILFPAAPSYALQRLAADARIEVAVAHRALADALTCAAVLDDLERAAAQLPPALLEEARATADPLGQAAVAFFRRASSRALRAAWQGPPDARRDPAGAGAVAPWPAVGDHVKRDAPTHVRAAAAQGPQGLDAEAAVALAADRVFSPGGPLAEAFAGYEERPQQHALAAAVERTFEAGGVLVAEAGTGVGKSLAYLVPALARAHLGERVTVSTQTLPLQDQLLRKDAPALQAALGTKVPVAALKGRSNYLCPRRWQLLRANATTRGEVRLVLKTLVWRQRTASGDRAELNLYADEAALWPRISADDEGCTARRCAMTKGGCYLERARSEAADAGIVVVNHALLLHDARSGGALLPEAAHLVVDEAHHLEDAAADAFGHRLEDWRLRRDLDRIGRSPAVLASLRGEDHIRRAAAEALREEVARSHELALETFGALAALLVGGEDRLRVTSGVRASEDTWLPVELAGERLADALNGARGAGERLAALVEDEDDASELRSGLKELIGATLAIRHGIHDVRGSDIVWLEGGSGAVGLHVAPAHVGAAIRRSVVDRHRGVVMTSATLAVAGSLAFAQERFGVADIADALRLGSPFDHASQAVLLVPTDIALPHEEDHPEHVAQAVSDIARVLGGRTLVLFTSHAAMRIVAARLEEHALDGIAVLTQGLDGSRRALLERFASGAAVLLGTKSFWEGVDLPGDMLQCVAVTRLPFDVPDDPLVEGRAERYEDPFTEYQLPQAALRLRQGVGRLIRGSADRGAIVLLDRRIITRDYGPTLLASLPPARLQRVRLEDLADRVAAHCRPSATVPGA